MKRALALGFFDGVHIGHAVLLNRTVSLAEELGLSPSVLSFDIHPDTLVFHSDLKLIGDASSRKELISRLFGIEDVIFLHFSKSVMEMPWDEFLENITEELDVAAIVAGYDFSFGAGGTGNPEKLTAWCREHGLVCEIVPKIELDGKTVSSTYIRSLIEEGNMEEAWRYLGHPHCLSDTVHAGYHIGRKLDAPTINLFFPPNVLVPKYGVYATKVILSDGGEYEAVTNVGVRPTVSEENKLSVESHLLNYSGNLYGMPARVDFYKFLRPEMKFESFEALGKQIKEDAEETHRYFCQTQEA